MIDVYLDIETIPCQSEDYRNSLVGTIKPPATYKKPESIAQWLMENESEEIEKAVSKTSFEPALGHVCTIGFAIGDGDIKSYHADTVEGEGDIISAFYSSLPDLGKVRLVGHNVCGFDARFLFGRSIVLGKKIHHGLGKDIKPWSDFYFDTMVAWAGTKGTISQDKLAKALGLKGKGGFDGSMVAQAWRDGEHEKISSYCRDDVSTVRSIHEKFKQAGY